MAKLNQIIAIANGKKSRTASTMTTVYHTIQKPELLGGISRNYRPKDEDGETLPPESKIVQVRVPQVLKIAAAALSDLFDTVATLDATNCEASADVKLADGTIILPSVPVTTLLFLEKQLVDVHTLIEKLPVLDPAEEWEYSADADCFASKSFETTRTKKIPRNHVLAEATKEHPAQVQMFTEDVIVGTWTTKKFSGSIPAKERNAMLGRVEKLQDAVKAAREQANGADIVDSKIGEAVFGFVIGK